MSAAGQKFIFVPYTGTNDAGMRAWNREADYFQQMILGTAHGGQP